MYQALLVFLAPLLQPSDRIRWFCLLLLVTLVTALLYFGSRPGMAVVFPYLLWDKLAHGVAFGGFAALGWIAMGGRSLWGPVLLAGMIGILDEGMQYFSPFRTADLRDLVADLTGALLVVLLLKVMRSRVVACPRS